jgi:hypothetical protein
MPGARLSAACRRLSGTPEPGHPRWSGQHRIADSHRSGGFVANRDRLAGLSSLGGCGSPRIAAEARARREPHRTASWPQCGPPKVDLAASPAIGGRRQAADSGTACLVPLPRDSLVVPLTPADAYISAHDEMELGIEASEVWARKWSTRTVLPIPAVPSISTSDGRPARAVMELVPQDGQLHLPANKWHDSLGDKPRSRAKAAPLWTFD